MYNILDVGTYHNGKLPKGSGQYWEFVQLMYGQCILNCHSGTDDNIVILPNEIVAVPPLSDYVLTCEGSMQANYIQLEHVILPSNQYFKVNISPNNILEDLFKHCIYFKNVEHNFDSVILYSIIDLFLACVIEFATIRRLSPIVEKLYIAIHRHYTDCSFNIKDILKHRNSKNYDYLRRLFKKELGISPIQFIRKLQIEYAMRLIRHGHKSNLSINHISAECGIADPYYFSRIFKAHIGVSPQQYINNLRNTSQSKFGDSLSVDCDT